MKYDELTPITYEEAASLLGRSRGMIYNVVSKGVLTPMRKVHRKGRLAREQVELFKDKELSLADLNHDEAAIWYEINRAITSPASKSKATSKPTPEQDIAILADLIDRLVDLSTDAIIELKANAGKELTPAQVFSFLLDSPSFHQIARLLGVDMEQVPPETTQAFTQVLEGALAKAMLKLIAAGAFPTPTMPPMVQEQEQEQEQVQKAS